MERNGTKFHFHPISTMVASATTNTRTLSPTLRKQLLVHLNTASILICHAEQYSWQHPFLQGAGMALARLKMWDT